MRLFHLVNINFCFLGEKLQAQLERWRLWIYPWPGGMTKSLLSGKGQEEYFGQENFGEVL